MQGGTVQIFAVGVLLLKWAQLLASQVQQSIGTLSLLQQHLLARIQLHLCLDALFLDFVRLFQILGSPELSVGSLLLLAC